MALTRAQLDSGADAIWYRAFQLYNANYLLESVAPVLEENPGLYIRNAAIDSALINARGLAWFLQSKTPSGGEVHASRYVDPWSDSMPAVTSATIDSASKHVGHTKFGPKNGAPHPGAWPVRELAEVYVNALLSFVERIPKGQRDFYAPLFRASQVQDMKEYLDATRRPPTPVSENPTVAKLTLALQGQVGLTTM